MVSLPSLRILMVSARSYPYAGGIETHVYEVSRRLQAMGHTVAVLSTDPSRRLPREEWYEGVHTLRVPAWPRHRDYYLAPGVFQTIARGQWDIIHCQGYNTAVPPLAMLAARRIATPYVVTFHSGGHSSRLRQSLRRFQHHTLRPLLAEARRLIAVSRFEAQFFATRLRFPEQKFVVIPNGCHTPLADTSSRDPTRPLLLSVGRLERYKGHHRVLDAFPHVLRAHPGARLRIVGTGPFESFLRQRAEQLGVTSAVEIGAVDPRRRDIMTQLFAEASLVLLLSDYEAHPIAVMEAIALGCPALVTATSGLAELADRGLAQAVPAASDTTTVAQAILANLANPPAPITTALPSWDHCADELAAVYERVVEEQRCAS